MMSDQNLAALFTWQPPTPAESRQYRRDNDADLWRLIREARTEMWIHGPQTQYRNADGSPLSSAGWWGPKQIVRNAITKRAGHFGCELCGCTRSREFHHLHYRCVGWELPRDLLRLCRRCHHRQHFRPHWIRYVEGLPVVLP